MNKIEGLALSSGVPAAGRNQVQKLWPRQPVLLYCPEQNCDHSRQAPGLFFCLFLPAAGSQKEYRRRVLSPR